MTLLVDTNLASSMGLQTAAESSTLALYGDVLEGQKLAIALQTMAEALNGAELGNWGKTRRALQRKALARFKLLLPDQKTAEIWAQLSAHAQRRGRGLSAGDAWIGATAVQHKLRLVTHDADLDGLAFPGLDVLCRVRAGSST